MTSGENNFTYFAKN